MTTDPSGPSVARATAFDETVGRTFALERSADGKRPSRRDFETLYWPILKTALASSWSSAETVDDQYPQVREIVNWPGHPAFPPARVVFVKEPAHLPNPRRLVIIGIDFDWGYDWSDDPSS